MLKKIFLLSFSIIFTFGNLASYDFEIKNQRGYQQGNYRGIRTSNIKEGETEQTVHKELDEKRNVLGNNSDKSGNIIDNENNIKNLNQYNRNIHSGRQVNKSGALDERGEKEDLPQLVLYYYLAVSFLLYVYKKIEPRSAMFSERGEYKGPLEEDVFAVYKEFFSNNDSKGRSTYCETIASFCSKSLKELLGEGGINISYKNAFIKMCGDVQNFLNDVEKIEINLEGNWEEESVQWAFTVALQVFTYKKIYKYINENISSKTCNSTKARLYHDFLYVKTLSMMLYKIFKNVIESFSSDKENIIQSKNLFFLKQLGNVVEKHSEIHDVFYSAFSNLVYRPSVLEGSTRTFLDCFFPIINQIGKN